MGGRRSTTQAPAAAVQLPPNVRGLLGAEADALLRELRNPAPVSLRLNPAKPAGEQGTPVPWCPQGRYLKARPSFTLDPLLHAGAYYVQEASSMLLEQAVRACLPLPPQAVVLDLCAAPGGKSTHLAACLPPDALLIANEPVRTRQPALAENLWKWGRPNVVLTGAMPADFTPMGACCHLVLVDAPCSGEGMFRKDPYARAQWGPNLVETCAVRQRQILDAAWPLVRPGGYLVYSTCTWEPCENEEQVQRLVDRGAVPLAIPADPEWGVETNPLGLRCYPHRMRGEGFFLAALHKPGAGDAPRPEGGGHAPVPEPIGSWLQNAEQWALLESGGVQHALGKSWAPLVKTLAASVRMIAPGIPVAVPKGHGWAPHAALAVNGLLDQRAFTVLDLDREAALRYLRGEALPGADAAGTALVRHSGLGLGWAHGAGKRWNNNWPQPWRIRLH